MPQTQQYEFREEQPSIISYSEYMLVTTETIFVGQPVMAYAVASEAINQNKVWCKRYKSTDSTIQCVGVATKPMWPVGHANEGRAGMGAYMRDLALLQFGLIPMFNCSDAEVKVGAAVSAVTLGDGSINSTDDTVVGFKAWEAGEAVLGFCHEYNIPGYDDTNDVVHMGLIFVMPSIVATATSLANLSDTTITAAATGDILIYDTNAWVDQPLTLALATDYTETTVAAGDLIGSSNGTVYVNLTPKIETLTTSSHIATLSSTPVGGLIAIIALATAAVVLVKPGNPATTQGTYSLVGTTLTFNATDVITTCQVSYLI